MASTATTAADRAARRARAAARRRAWSGVVVPLAELPEVELVDGSPSELMALAFELSEAAWALSGRAMPDYPREQIPGRLVRRPQ